MTLCPVCKQKFESRKACFVHAKKQHVAAVSRYFAMTLFDIAEEDNAPA